MTLTVCERASEAISESVLQRDVDTALFTLLERPTDPRLHFRQRYCGNNMRTCVCVCFFLPEQLA